MRAAKASFEFHTYEGSNTSGWAILASNSSGVKPTP